MAKTKQLGPIVEESTTGFLMPESIASAIGELSKGLPAGFGYRRVAKAVDDFKLNAGERTDVSVVSTDDPDRDGEVLLPGGADWSQYNKVVFFGHAYTELPVGSCWWMKTNATGIVAKTHYPPKPSDWGDAPWMPSAILHLMQQPVPCCTGKSVGLMPQQVRKATADELSRRPDWRGKSVVARWKGFEYSVCGVAINENAEMIAVSKSVDAGLLDRAAAELIVKGIHARPIILTSPDTKAVTMADTDKPADEKPGDAPADPDPAAAEPKHEFSSVMAKMPKMVAKHAKAMGRRVKDEHLHEAGREEDPHLTAKFGLHTNDPEVVRKALVGEGPAHVRFGKVGVFPAAGDAAGNGGSGEHDVVHVEAHSPDLERINGKLEAALPHTKTFPKFTPHMTLCYTKPGMGEQYKDMDGADDMDGHEMSVKSLTFSDRDGNEHDIPLDGPDMTTGGAPEPGAVTTKAVDAANESSIEAGGAVVPPGLADLPKCPKCADGGKMMPVPDSAGRYQCKACGGQFAKSADGTMNPVPPPPLDKRPPPAARRRAMPPTPAPAPKSAPTPVPTRYDPAAVKAYQDRVRKARDEQLAESVSERVDVLVRRMLGKV